VVGVPGQDAVHVPDLVVEDCNTNHACVLILLLDMADVIVSVSDLFHIVATHMAVQVR